MLINYKTSFAFGRFLKRCAQGQELFVRCNSSIEAIEETALCTWCVVATTLTSVCPINSHQASMKAKQLSALPTHSYTTQILRVENKTHNMENILSTWTKTNFLPPMCAQLCGTHLHTLQVVFLQCYNILNSILL